MSASVFLLYVNRQEFLDDGRIASSPDFAAQGPVVFLVNASPSEPEVLRSSLNKKLQFDNLPPREIAAIKALKEESIHLSATFQMALAGVPSGYTVANFVEH
jgi:hypothetical protein